MNRLPVRLITELNQSNHSVSKMLHNSEAFGPRGCFGKESTPKQPVSGGLHMSSNSYFPQPQNRLSSVSNKLSEVSEVVETRSVFDTNTSFDINQCHQSPMVQRDSLPGDSSSSFVIDEAEEHKFTYNSKKIFVGGLPHGITENEFKDYFCQYCEIEDCVVMYDRATGKPRGFGFITYKEESSIDLVLRDKLKHKIRNKWIECKRATPKTTAGDSNCSAQDLTMNTSYTYSTDVVIPGSYDPLVRKLSVENISFSKINDHDSMHASQTTCPTTLVSMGEENCSPDLVNVNQSYASYEDKPQDSFFENIDQFDDEKHILEKAESLKWEEDGVNTYSDIFEDFHKSENGSDWHISTNDPYEIKDTGFPQTLPTSDIGSIFSKYKNKKILNKAKMNSDKNTDLQDLGLLESEMLLPPNLKNELKNEFYEETIEQAKVNDEQTELNEKFLDLSVNDQSTAASQTPCTNLKPVYNPDFKCKQSHSTQNTDSDLQLESFNSAEPFGCAPKGAYFYHNQPKF